MMIRPQGQPRQREKPYRFKAYRQHVASQPCMACGWSLPNDVGAICQAAHIRTGYYGISDKPDDWFTIPLCTLEANGCHDKFGKGEIRFTRERWGITIDELKKQAESEWMIWEEQRTVTSDSDTRKETS